ncbi:MAG TPA: sigma-70 family RNA polymerase sigma factor [Vicinamibacterales bacterium]|nr:sigma-70 family RNA polymerase sigma factor [Vicinamibacterales bacterium]
MQEVTHLTPSVGPAVVKDLLRKAGAERWALSHDEFAEALAASVGHAFAAGEPTRRELDRYLAGLHVADLALACACALGREAAWDYFVLEHRPILYRAADALDPTGGARELADSLYADLYGMKHAGPDRRSLFRYFHGRSSLATWLRAVLAQRHVDALRSRRRVEPMPDDDAAIVGVAAPESDPDRSPLIRVVENALRAAIGQLTARDRLRLRSYYVTQLTLAQIGRITGEHEATVSRQLTRTRRALREAIERHLREQAHLSSGQIERAVELALEDPGSLDLQQVIDSSRDLSGDVASDRKESPGGRSK